MGLDMNLYIRKGEYKDVEIKDYPTEELGELVTDFDSTYVLESKKYNVMYWRKANHIHKYFIKECADGVDECQEISVEKEKLNDLHVRCLTVLADHSKAKELLPTGEGFFFGSTDYDEYYYEDIRRTAEFLTKFIDILKKPEYKYYTIVYQASW